MLGFCKRVTYLYLPVCRYVDERRLRTLGANMDCATCVELKG